MFSCSGTGIVKGLVISGCADVGVFFKGKTFRDSPPKSTPHLYSFWEAQSFIEDAERCRLLVPTLQSGSLSPCWILSNRHLLVLVFLRWGKQVPEGFFKAPRVTAGNEPGGGGAL